MGLPIALRAGEPKLAVMSACLTCGVQTCGLRHFVLSYSSQQIHLSVSIETYHSCTREQDSQEAWT